VQSIGTAGKPGIEIHSRKTEMQSARWCLVWGFFWVFVPVSAQQTGKISAKVTESGSGLGVNQVSVHLIQDEVIRYSTRSNPAGNFSFVNIPAGSFKIQVRKDGYREFKKTIVMNPGGTLKLRVDLVSEKEVRPAETPAVTLASAAPDKKQEPDPGSPQQMAGITGEPESAGEKNPVSEADAPAEGNTEPEQTPDYMDFPDEPAQPEGGLAAITRNVVYPPSAMHLGLEGKVVLSVMVDQDGTPAQITVLSPAHELLNEAAIETVYRTRFTPASHNGRKVASKVSVPVQFKLKSK